MTQQEARAGMSHAPHLGRESRYRADIDHSGRWCVWQRLGMGWAVLRACRDRGEAIERAAELNRAMPVDQAG